MYLNRHTGESHDGGFDLILAIVECALFAAAAYGVLHIPELIAALIELATYH